MFLSTLSVEVVSGLWEFFMQRVLKNLKELKYLYLMGVVMFVQACPSFCKISRGTPRNFSGRSSFDKGIEDQGIVNQYREF